MDEAYVSLITNDDYANGAFVLGKSLKNTKTTKKLVLMVTKGVSEKAREKLCSIWDDLVDVTLLDSQDKEKLVLLARPELGCTFSKLRAWTLSQYRKCVFLDADTLVIQNVDDLFERRELSAAPDIGWPDCFNSGVFVFEPNLERYLELLEFAETRGSFDGGDQGLLNEFFDDWSIKDIRHHLPFVYNMVSNVCYSYAPAFNRYGKDVKIVHFLGSMKPWHHHYDDQTGKVIMVQNSRYSAADETFNQLWWDLYKDTVPSLPSLSTSGLPSPSHTELPTSWQNWNTYVSESETLLNRQSAWRQGSPDYTGEDRFSNIMNHINQMMLKTPSETSKPTAVKAGSSAASKTETTTVKPDSRKSVASKTTKPTTVPSLTAGSAASETTKSDAGR